MTWIQIIGACSAIILGLIKFWIWWKSKKDAQRQALLKSAENLAESTLRVENEARKTSKNIDKFNSSTPVADGNKLLSGDDCRD